MTLLQKLAHARKIYNKYKAEVEKTKSKQVGWFNNKRRATRHPIVQQTDTAPGDANKTADPNTGDAKKPADPNTGDAKKPAESNTGGANTDAAATGGSASDKKVNLAGYVKEILNLDKDEVAKEEKIIKDYYNDETKGKKYVDEYLKD